jgi:hypothetical protein
MSSYPLSIRRCQHIKTNGTQCGSPAMREHNYCYFHMRWHQRGMQVKAYLEEQQIITLPTLEDANSIQVGLAEVMRQLVAQLIDHRTAALLLYALQTASANVKFTSFEPERPTQVVIDRECVAHRPLGASAWSKVEGRDYDDLAQENSPAEKDGEKCEKNDGAPGVPARPEECQPQPTLPALPSTDT